MLGVCLAVLLGGLIGIAGCLNPRPEEDPSFMGSPTADDGSPGNQAPQPTAPERESCEDNTLLAGCEPPTEDGEEINEPAPPAQTPGFGGPADAGPIPPGDAGSDAGTAGSPGSSVAE